MGIFIGWSLPHFSKSHFWGKVNIVYHVRHLRKIRHGSLPPRHGSDPGLYPPLCCLDHLLLRYNLVAQPNPTHTKAIQSKGNSSIFKNKVRLPQTIASL